MSGMNNRKKIEAASALLLKARASGELLPRMPLELAPADSAEAYAIQHEVAAALGAIGGWKVGAKGPAAEPACAPLPSNLIYAAPHSFALSGSQAHGVEAEIALKLKQDLPPRAEPYLAADVRAAVGSIHPAIEVVASRFADPGRENPLSLLADALANAGFLYGEGSPDRIDIDQTRQAVKLSFGSETVADVVGGNPAGDIWRLLAWLANHAARHYGGLRAGQIVTTGSCTGLLFPQSKTGISAAFADLGRVETSFI
jgi:2-keto-4-pentenoate hydratase